MAKSDFNSDIVRQLATVLDETGLTEIEYGEDNWHIRIAKNSAPVAMAAAAPMAAAPAPGLAPTSTEDDLSAHPGCVPSPMVGVAYLASDPETPNFVNIGDTVSEGQTLLLVEAMKVFNPIHAPRGGKVTQILVESGSPVEYGEPLVIIE